MELTLTDVLEPTAPEKYWLSARAARGILRRAEKRGRTILPSLFRALSAVAEGSPETTSTGGGLGSLSGMGNGGPDDNDAQANRIVVSHALTSAGCDASEDGTWRGTPIVADTVRSHPRPGSNSDGLLAVALTSGGHPNRNASGRRKEDDFNIVSFNASGGGEKGLQEREDVANPVTGSNGDPGAVVTFTARGRNGGTQIETQTDGVHPALRSGRGGGRRDSGFTDGVIVRRLMPVECERLQGFPDDWTMLNEETPDTPRYSALGDAVTVPVGEFFGIRAANSQETGDA